MRARAAIFSEVVFNMSISCVFSPMPIFQPFEGTDFAERAVVVMFDRVQAEAEEEEEFDEEDFDDDFDDDFEDEIDEDLQEFEEKLDEEEVDEEDGDDVPEEFEDDDEP
jgi:hypothetical protein